MQIDSVGNGSDSLTSTCPRNGALNSASRVHDGQMLSILGRGVKIRIDFDAVASVRGRTGGNTFIDLFAGQRVLNI